MSKICLIIAGDLNIGEARRSICCIKHIMLYQKPISIGNLVKRSNAETE
jgi:hypothetical protein